ncbi:MAG: serine/threonine protein kinase [Planctomycetes bacterium]|nr:serine/threonine protein kinase [Planctomycetota bacterium]
MNTTTCPCSDELQKLIDGSLSGERQQECTRHMDSCECCQSKLEVMATGGTNLSQILVHANEVEPIASSAYWPALKELSADLDETFVPRSTPRSREVSLQFLQPATDPAYLGRLSHFDVMRVLGRGGMGIVLEAFDSKLQRHVALKVLDPDLAHDEVSRKRFCREARSAASITHENVVAVHQVEKSDGDNLPYLVMQLISGESLEQRLTREKKLPLREIVRIAMEAAHGLAAAHAQGLIHRDIKPGNILLESPGDRVKLTDFGLARVADDVKLTTPGFVTGTPLYMAPEQALDKEADPRSDLFSFGAILYEMCAGEPPFTGNSALAILKQLSEVKHRPLRELNPEIPEWLSRTIDHLLEKRPEDRIQSAAHLAELLDYEWALMKTSSEDVPVVCQIALRKRAQRNRRIAIGVGATFLTVGLMAGMFLANRNRTPVVPVDPTAKPALKSSAEPVATLAASAGSVWSVAFDKSGKNLAMAVEDGNVRLWDIASQSVSATLTAHRGMIYALRYSPNGELLATAGDDGLVKLWTLAQPGLEKTFKHPSAVRDVVFSNDQQSFYTVSKDGGLRVWSVADTEQEKRATTQSGALYAIALSPDNGTIATAGSDKIVRLWNASTLAQKLPLEGHTAPVYALSFNHDGKRVASAGWDRTIRIWDAGSGQLIKSWSGHDGDVWSVAYSPDGTQLASGGSDGAVKLWDGVSGTLLATFLGHDIAVHTVAFNRDGTQLASGGRDGAVRIWNVSSEQ